MAIGNKILVDCYTLTGASEKVRFQIDSQILIIALPLHFS